jgi:hypothetical protein
MLGSASQDLRGLTLAEVLQGPGNVLDARL